MKDWKRFISQVLEETAPEDFTDEADNRNMFYSFLGRFSAYFQKRVEELLKEKLQKENMEIASYNTAVVYRLLYSASVRTMIAEIHKWKEENKEISGGDSPNERYLLFMRQFRDVVFFVRFCNTYAVLISKFQTIMDNTLQLLKEALDALCEDREQLKEIFGFDATLLSAVEMTDGDSHNGGRRALFLTAGEKRLLYKPHGLSTDRLLAKLYEEVNSFLSLPLKCPLFLDRKTYGWQEFVEKKACGSEEEYRRYYYRYGELTALAYSLNMTDLHMENLIGCGEYPVVIDTETIIANDCYNFDKEKTKAFDCDTPGKLFNRTVSKSVLNTLLLPNNLLGGIFDIDLSPMAVADTQRSEKITEFKLAGEFTDEVRMEAETYIREPEEERGQAHNPCAYLQELMDGFTEMYTGILERKEEMQAFFCRTVKEDALCVRQVLRPTYVYGKFADASNHPDYLREEAAQEALFLKLKSKLYQEEGKMGEQADMERKSLLEGDIPYFYEKADETALWSIYGKVDNFYKKTILELVRERINAMSKDDLCSQLRILRLSMSTLFAENWNRGERQTKLRLEKGHPSAFERAEELPVKVGDYLCREAVYEEQGRFAVWVSHALLSPKLKIGPGMYYLYDCGGAILFLHYLAKAGGEKRYKETADAILNGFPHQAKSDALSAYNGIGSLLYLSYTLYLLWGERSYYELYREVLLTIADRELTEGIAVDYCGGLAGMAVLCQNLYRKEQDETLKSLAVKYTDYCLAHGNEVKLAGLAHGYAGLFLAAAGMYDLCGERKYEAAAYEYLEKENALYEPKAGNWKDLRDEGGEEALYWCHGAVGIGLARMKGYSYLKRKETCKKDLENSIRKTVKDMGALTDYSLCHGQLGCMDALLSFAQFAQGKEELSWGNNLELLLEKRFPQILKGMKRDGLLCGVSNAHEMFSFMLGIPGMAYAVLRFQKKDLPSVLLLEF